MFRFRGNIVLGFVIVLALGCGSHNDESDKPPFNPHPSPAYLSPEESLKTIYLPKGYHMELVASEPMIKEPVCVAWDGDGRMYVAEMLTYMRDADATNEQLPWSQISLLEDTDHDGKMDKSTVFVDSLLLPRMMQAVGDELLVNETNSIKITGYKDSNHDGKADVKRVVYDNDRYEAGDANMEHQRSGLDWNLDNWMYMTYEPARFKYVNGHILVDSIPSGAAGQWGLTHDDYGRLFFSSAGGETPVLGFQINPVYGRLEFQDQIDAAFQEVWPIIATPDVQGGVRRLRPNITLNHFTASCGQSIFRGDRLPADMEGDYFVCEPVGRIVRRAKIINKEGKLYLKNAYDKEEFISSSDMNFRPVNSYTGPDGNLYIVDMYRGIIQQGNWTRKGSFLRKKIDSLGLAKNINRGRIYRVVYDGMKPGPQPHMLEESSATLVHYLGHPNGWWRDNAQKLIVVRGDKSVVPTLKQIVLRASGIPAEDTSHLAQIHALWTLEGLDAIDKPTLKQALADPDSQVRRTAVWISERYIQKGDDEMIDAVAALENDPSYDVRVQILLSSYGSKSKKAEMLEQSMLKNNAANEMITASYDALQKKTMVSELSAQLAGFNKDDKRVIMEGAVTFRSICANCHGIEGKGISIGNSAMPAPPLINATALRLDKKDMAIRILLHGMKGPVEGKSYPSEMPSMKENRDRWISSVLSYARYQFGDKDKKGAKENITVSAAEVKAIRDKYADRNNPWTMDELKQIK